MSCAYLCTKENYLITATYTDGQHRPYTVLWSRTPGAPSWLRHTCCFFTCHHACSLCNRCNVSRSDHWEQASTSRPPGFRVTCKPDLRIFFISKWPGSFTALAPPLFYCYWKVQLFIAHNKVSIFWYRICVVVAFLETPWTLEVWQSI